MKIVNCIHCGHQWIERWKPEMCPKCDELEKQRAKIKSEKIVFICWICNRAKFWKSPATEFPHNICCNRFMTIIGENDEIKSRELFAENYEIAENSEKE